jgi:hypothetical protein
MIERGRDRCIFGCENPISVLFSRLSVKGHGKSIDSFVLSFIFTGSVKIAGSIVGAEATRKGSSTIFTTKSLVRHFAGMSKDKLVAGPVRPDSAIQAANVMRLAGRSTGPLEALFKSVRVLMLDHLATTV